MQLTHKKVPSEWGDRNKVGGHSQWRSPLVGGGSGGGHWHKGYLECGSWDICSSWAEELTTPSILTTLGKGSKWHLPSRWMGTQDRSRGSTLEEWLWREDLTHYPVDSSSLGKRRDEPSRSPAPLPGRTAKSRQPQSSRGAQFPRWTHREDPWKVKEHTYREREVTNRTYSWGNSCRAARTGVQVRQIGVPEQARRPHATTRG